MYVINDIENYDKARARGFEPLIDRRFYIEPTLRKELQKNLFGKNNPEGHQKFYKWVWKHSNHYCEECLKELPCYSATYVSHILSRGAHPEMAHDPRNVNILCFKHHEMWESAVTRKRMQIFERNEKTINQLKSEYND